MSSVYRLLPLTSPKTAVSFSQFLQRPLHVHFSSRKSNKYGKRGNSSHKSPQTLLEEACTNEEYFLSQPMDVWHTGPCYTGTTSQNQADHSYHPMVDPRQTSIILFPGQGTQYVGMGKELVQYPNVKEMYERASEIVGFDVLDVCLNGPLTELSRTQVQQVAVFVTSLAAVEKLREEKPEGLSACVATAGFSVGEITALTFAHAFTFEEAVKLIKVRGESMQLASEMSPSGMMTVFYGPDSRLGFACSIAKEICLRKGIENADCAVANYLYPHCKVIAGNDEALEFIVQNKGDFKLRKLKYLNVSGGFHTSLMKPAADAVRQVLSGMDIRPPMIPVHTNITGKRYTDVNSIIKQLPKQVHQPVRWEQTMHILYERDPKVSFPNTYECGPGTSLKTILKMVNAKAWVKCDTIGS